MKDLEDHGPAINRDLRRINGAIKHKGITVLWQLAYNPETILESKIFKCWALPVFVGKTWLQTMGNVEENVSWCIRKDRKKKMVFYSVPLYRIFAKHST